MNGQGCRPGDRCVRGLAVGARILMGQGKRGIRENSAQVSGLGGWVEDDSVNRHREHSLRDKLWKGSGGRRKSCLTLGARDGA